MERVILTILSSIVLSSLSLFEGLLLTVLTFAFVL